MLIYGACQIGMHVDIDDMALHTLLDVNSYAASVMSGKAKTDMQEAVPLSSLGSVL